MLVPGERVLHTAFMVRQPGLLVQILLAGGLLLFLLTKAYYVVLTDRRLLVMRTKQGMFKPAMMNLGVEQFDVTQIASCTTSGFANNRSMTFHMRNGPKQTLRIAPWFTIVSGTKAFFEQVPQLLSSGQLAAGAGVAGALGPAQGAPAQPQGGGIAPGTSIVVLWSDGNRYPATVVQSANGQVLCAMPNGQQHWVPGQNVMPG